WSVLSLTSCSRRLSRRADLKRKMLRSVARQDAASHQHSDHCGAQRRTGRAISANEETRDCAEVPQDGVILTRWAACGESVQVPSGFPGGIGHIGSMETSVRETLAQAGGRRVLINPDCSAIAELSGAFRSCHKIAVESGAQFVRRLATKPTIGGRSAPSALLVREIQEIAGKEME